jgi:hypothetical protein
VSIHDAVVADMNANGDRYDHPYPPAEVPPMHQQVQQLRTELNEAQNRIRDLEAALTAVRGVIARELNIT